MGRKGQRTSEGLAEAERLFRRAIDLDDRFALAYVGLADTLKLQVDYAGGSVALLDEADGKVAKAAALDATLAEVWVSKGGIASSRGEAALAAEFLQRAVALNPNSATAHHWLSRALAITGHLQDATNHAEQAAQLDPLSMVVLTNLAGYLEYVARFEDAEQAYRRALEIDPASSVALAGLGSLRAYVFNQFQDALDLTRRAAAADPASPRILGMLGGLLIDLGELERSRGVRDELTRRWPDNPTANEYSLYISAVLGDAMADGLAERFIAKEPNSWLASKVARNVDLARDDVAAARARYEVGFPELFGSSPRVDASNVSPAIDLALVLATQGDHEAAVRLLSASEDVISTQPRLGAGGYGLMDVQILAMRGERERALVALQQAVEDGWRGKAWRYFRDIEPNLASIRNTAKFKAAFDAVEQDLQRQRMR
jgi:tetratricopeptide (TPR) repeat protein